MEGTMCTEDTLTTGGDASDSRPMPIRIGVMGSTGTRVRQGGNIIHDKLTMCGSPVTAKMSQQVWQHGTQARRT